MAGYCDVRVCWSVCLSACMGLSQTTQHFLGMLPLAVAWSSGGTVCTSGFVDDVMLPVIVAWWPMTAA